MSSQIDDTFPVTGKPETQSVRANFTTAKQEITALQAATTGGPFLPLAGGRLTGPMYLWNDPTDVMMPATKGYVDAHAGSGGGGGIPEAPADGKTYGRDSGAWVAAVPLAGDTMTGLLTLSGPPTAALHAATKAYVDTMGAAAAGAVQKAGDTMTGLLTLSGPPTANLHAATKLYVDSAAALLAPINNPTFTGTVTAGGSGHIFAASGAPSLVLNDTTLGRPVFGLFNSGALFGIGLASLSTGNANGTPFLRIDQTGIVTLSGPLTVSSGGVTLTSGNLSLSNGAIFLAGGEALSGAAANTGWTNIYDNGGLATLVLGNSGSPANYQRQTQHIFQDRAASTNFAVIDGGGIHLNDGYQLLWNNNTVSIFSSGGAIYQRVPVSGGQFIWQSLDASFQYAVFNSVGTYNASGAWLVQSDRELKEDIAPYMRGLDAILALRPISFRYKEGTTFASADQHIGLIADEVAPHLPELVGEFTDDGRTVATLAPGNLIYPLVNAVKELAALVKDLAARIEAIEARL
jgi:Chaperone of endosialidase